MNRVNVVIRRFWPLAAGLTACLMVGCSSDDNNYVDQPQPQQQESRNYSSSRDVTASMAFPTGNRNSSQLLVEEIAPREVRVGKPIPIVCA